MPGKPARRIGLCPALARPGPRGGGVRGAQRPGGAVALNVLRRSYRDIAAILQDSASGGPGRASGARSPGLTCVALRVTMQADVGRTSGPSTMISRSPVSGCVIAPGAARQRHGRACSGSAHVDVLPGADMLGSNRHDGESAQPADTPGALSMVGLPE